MRLAFRKTCTNVVFYQISDDFYADGSENVSVLFNAQLFDPLGNPNLEYRVSGY